MKQQAIAPEPVFFGKEAFEKTEGTVIRWLGNGGALINSQGTCLMLDPLLKGFDMPLWAEPPIQPASVPDLEAVLITHSDNDHFSRITCQELKEVCRSYHAPHYVAGLLRELGLPAEGHEIGAEFEIGGIRVRLTPADHAWQNVFGQESRIFQMEDFCGYWLDTEDGSIWLPGDSRLMEEQLKQPQPDVILLDFSDSSWHIGLEGAVRLTGQYPEASLLLIHWGCVKSDMPEFAGDPEELRKRIVNPNRMYVVAPGEAWKLR